VYGVVIDTLPTVLLPLSVSCVYCYMTPAIPTTQGVNGYPSSS